MFSSLRSRLWLSYALLIVTALSLVALVLFVYLIRNPFLYRQTLERLRTVQAVVTQRNGQSLSIAAEHVSQNFGVRILLFSQDKQVLLDTHAGKEPALPFPGRKLLPRNNSIVRDGLADLGHSILRNGNSPTAITSTGITAIIIRMTQIKKAQSVALTGIVCTRKPLR